MVLPAGFPGSVCFCMVLPCYSPGLRVASHIYAGAQFEGDLGEILALGAEISPYNGLREK